MRAEAIEVPKTVAAEEGIRQLDDAAQKLLAHRKKSLLILFYPPVARMSEDDLDDVYTAFRQADVKPEKKLASLDVLIDSYGGHPVAAYRLAQLIRDFADEVFFSVPNHAYSAATLLTFCGNAVRLGHFAGLSPIDITLVSDSGRSPRREVELATVDSFQEFAVQARKRIEELLEQLGCDGKTNVDSDLLVTMVKEVGPLQVGKFFRERVLTGHYAEELLEHYMFHGFLDRRDRRTRVVTNFLFGAPAHEFHVDYHLANKWGLAVSEMDTDESDLSKDAVAALEELAEAKIICPNISRSERIPFIRFYPYAPVSASAADPNEHEKEGAS